MAVNTPIAFRNLVIYQVYVRNHGPNGKFTDVTSDLSRIRKMGVDILYLMPVHPIGIINKKGSLGCPYSISDYHKVNPEYGTEEDLRYLIEEAHNLGLKVMIDIVFNHTSYDSILVQNHPEWFYHDLMAKPTSTVPEWSDVIDLKYGSSELNNYHINVLIKWVEFGIDGFRCDVASIVPLEFWMEARQTIEKIKPEIIWLAESVHTSFIEERRAKGLVAYSDAEIFSAFDIAYDYDLWQTWQLTVHGKIPVSRYLEMLRFQDCSFPNNYVKLRCVENHDQLRIMKLAANRELGMAWTAFMAFNKGAFMVYAGQESGATRTPSLFDTDKVLWNDYDLQPFLTTLIQLKKDVCQRDGRFYILSCDTAIQAIWYKAEISLFGIFNISGIKGPIQVDIEDGEFIDLISGRNVVIRNHFTEIPASAVVFHCAHPGLPKSFHSELIDSSNV